MIILVLLAVSLFSIALVDLLVQPVHAQPGSLPQGAIHQYRSEGAARGTKVSNVP